MRVTARGWGLLLGGAVLVGVGLGWGYPELTIVGCAGVVAFALALAAAARRWTLDASRIVAPERVVRGDSCRGVVTIHNRARWRGVDLLATDRCQMPDGVTAIPVPLLRLGAGKEQTVHYALPTFRRGVVTVGPMTVSRRDVFDLVRTIRECGGERRVWVHPHVHPLRAIPAGAARSMDGHVDKVEHGSIMFHALREYVPGDDLRHVHWRTSAKIGALMVREHLDTSLPRMVLLLDDRASAYSGSEPFEVTVDIAASVVVAALRENLAMDLHTTSGQLVSLSDPSLGRGNSVQVFLDALAEVHTHPTPSEPAEQPGELRDAARLREAGQRIRHRRQGDTFVMLTGSAGVRDLGAVTALRDVFASVVCGVVNDPLVSTGPGMTSEAGSRIISTTSAEEFAAVWDGVRAW